MQYLYRAYDGDDTLLYVGVSGKWSERLHSHEKNSEWMEQTDYVTIQRFPDRDSVLAAERLAITKEGPLFNKDHNVAYEKAMDHVQKLKFWLYYETPTDELHAKLLRAMRRDLIEDFPLDYSRKQTRYMMWLFEQFYPHAKADGFDCRNCEAISRNGQFRLWSRKVEGELQEAGYYDD